MTMTTITLPTLSEASGMRFDEHLDVDDPVPVLTGPQAQGDIYILPVNDRIVGLDPTEPLPGGTFDVIEGQGIRNPHTLLDLDGECLWVAGTSGYRFDVGTLKVPRTAVCWLIHPEHGGNGIGPGIYVIRRQREQGEEIRAVAD